MLLSTCLAFFHHDLPFLEDNVCLKNRAANMTLALAFNLSGHPSRSLPASDLSLDPDLTPDLLQLLALICSHLTPCAPKWMCQEILQMQRSNSASLLTSTSAVLHLSGLRAWKDTWERKIILQRAATEDLPRNAQVNRKAVSAVKIDASFSRMGRKHILGTPAACCLRLPGGYTD